MNKKLLLPILGLTLTCSVAVGVISHAVFANEQQAHTYHVDFFNNYLREEFTLSNGQKGKGNNLIYKTVDALENSLLEKPTDPVRARYEFQGWYLEEKCETEWNFASDIVKGNLRLFAKWGVGQQDQGNEPDYNPPSTVLENGETDYIINSVMHFKYDSNNQLKLPTSAIKRLEAHSDNVLPLMEYKVKAGKTITATYASNKITVTCGTEVFELTVKDNSTNFVLDNSTYENKAKNYEAKINEEDENYHVMLAGSSSIEFWTSSKEDLLPVVSYNHGIGGTTIE